MKTTRLRSALVGLLVGSALVLPLSAVAQSGSPDPSTAAPIKPDNRLTQNVSGKVQAKTDTTLTVDSRTITLTSATTYSKNGTAIGSGDVKVGDMVNIVTTDDGQVAVSVNVTVSS